MPWIPALAVLVTAAALAGCDRAPSSPPAPKAGLDTTEAPAQRGATVGPGAAPSTPVTRP